MANLRTCQQIKHCAESEYLHCTAYWQGKNCWEIGEGFCCIWDKNKCGECEIFLAHLEDKKRLQRIPTQ